MPDNDDKVATMTEYKRYTQHMMESHRAGGLSSAGLLALTGADALVELSISEHRDQTRESLVPTMVELLALDKALLMRVTLALLSALTHAELENEEAVATFDALNDEGKAKVKSAVDATGR